MTYTNSQYLAQGSIIKKLDSSDLVTIKSILRISGTSDLGDSISAVNCLGCQIKEKYTLDSFNALSVPSRDTGDRYSHIFNVSFLRGKYMTFNKYVKGLMKKKGLKSAEKYTMGENRFWLSLAQSNRINENRDFDVVAFHRAYRLISIFLDEFVGYTAPSLSFEQFDYKLRKFYRIGLESNKTDGIFFNYIPRLSDAPIGFVVQNKRVYLFAKLPYGEIPSIAVMKAVLRALTDSFVHDTDELDSEFLFNHGYKQLRRKSYYAVRTFLKLIYNNSIQLLPSEFLMRYGVEDPKKVPAHNRLYNLIGKNERNNTSVALISQKYSLTMEQAQSLKNPIYNPNYKMTPTTPHNRYGDTVNVTHNS